MKRKAKTGLITLACAIILLIVAVLVASNNEQTISELSEQSLIQSAANGLFENIAAKTDNDSDDDLDDKTIMIQTDDQGEQEYTIETLSYAVSTANEYATLVAAEVLESGGNAVDAAIAAAYILGVTEPYGSGLGGSGGMLVYDPDSDDYTFFDYYAMAAPSGTKSNNIAVPGFVSGMETAHDMYGTMEMSDLISYAELVARDGFEVGSELAYRINAYTSYWTPSMPYYGVEEGDTLVQTELADTLALIAENGAEAFYKGVVADSIVSSTSLTYDDLTSFKADITDPVISEFAGYEVAGAPAPFSGVTVMQMLKMMYMTNIANPELDPQSYVDTFVKIKLAAGNDRSTNIGDQVDIDYEYLMSTAHLTDLLDNDVSDDYDMESESTDTTHISVVDGNGMTVSMTNTLSGFWGSKIYVDGFFMNNTLTNFSSGVNLYERGKRPRTFTSPLIIRDTDSDTIMAIGSPGGNIISDVIAQVTANIIYFDVDPQEAVEKQRIVVQGKNSIMMETDLGTPNLIDCSDISGYYIVRNNSNRKFGSVNVAGIQNGEYFAVSDPHRVGCGYAVNG